MVSQVFLVQRDPANRRFRMKKSTRVKTLTISIIYRLLEKRQVGIKKQLPVFPVTLKGNH